MPASVHVCVRLFSTLLLGDVGISARYPYSWFGGCGRNECDALDVDARARLSLFCPCVCVGFSRFSFGCGLGDPHKFPYNVLCLCARVCVCVQYDTQHR